MDKCIEFYLPDTEQIFCPYYKQRDRLGQPSLKIPICCKWLKRYSPGYILLNKNRILSKTFPYSLIFCYLSRLERWTASRRRWRSWLQRRQRPRLGLRGSSTVLNSDLCSCNKTFTPVFRIRIRIIICRNQNFFQPSIYIWIQSIL